MEDEIVATICIIMICAALKKLTKKKRVKRKYWTRPWIRRRDTFGAHHALLNELRSEDPRSFRNFIRMNDESFQELLNLVTPLINRKDSCMRNAITAAERLSVTLRFLATGDNYQSLEYLFRIPKQTLQYIIPETCTAIYNVLKGDYLKVSYGYVNEIQASVNKTLVHCPQICSKFVDINDVICDNGFDIGDVTWLC
ncbi:hypothetical protein FSP39_009298 [Pinctada imbricata]|uniref:Uncharacterized protein n=1 Tax=Pinctada imbricata TaxID=66713 RepID=A0AA88Y3S9_PINIB|nr:hypothetical protein FSP39_009298 [Pinctada imbricata]